ncbi:MAG TPA: hypothetical protein VFK15_07215 [Burkholderiales bacterium]|nr:hypothetical protein [Burkholderiales bacterium]
MFGLSTLKLIGIGVGALAIIALLALVNTWRVGYHDRGEKLAAICQATRAASGHPKLACGEVPAQIAFMGEAMSTLDKALKQQNAAVAAMGTETKRQQQESAAATKAAAKRAESAVSVSAKLAASSKVRERTEKPCEPSAELRRAWQ